MWKPYCYTNATNNQIEEDDEELEVVAHFASSNDDDKSLDEAVEDNDKDKHSRIFICARFLRFCIKYRIYV